MAKSASVTRRVSRGLNERKSVSIDRFFRNRYRMKRSPVTAVAVIPMAFVHLIIGAIRCIDVYTSQGSMEFKRNSGYQWRIIVGLTLLVLSYILRVAIIRFTLQLLRRAVPKGVVYIKEFEHNLTQPLSWILFVLLTWLCIYLMRLRFLLRIDSSTLVSIITLALSVPLIWTVINLCKYVTWVS